MRQADTLLQVKRLRPDYSRRMKWRSLECQHNQNREPNKQGTLYIVHLLFRTSSLALLNHPPRRSSQHNWCCKKNSSHQPTVNAIKNIFDCNITGSSCKFYWIWSFVLFRNYWPRELHKALQNLSSPSSVSLGYHSAARRKGPTS